MITKAILPIAGAAYFIHAALGIIDNSAAALDRDTEVAAAMMVGHAPHSAVVGAYAGHIVGASPPCRGGLDKGVGRGRGPALPGPMPGRRGPSGRSQERR